MIEPLACPKCGNTTEQQGITSCYLEWRIMEVKGQTKDAVVVDFDTNEGADIESNVVTTMTNVPSKTPDLRHLFCNKCNYNWFDEREEIGAD